MSNDDVIGRTVKTGFDPSNVVDLELAKRRRLVALDPGQAMAEARVDAEQDDRERRVRLMLLAIVRAQGRVRIERVDLDAVSSGGKLDVKVQADGSLVVSFLS